MTKNTGLRTKNQLNTPYNTNVEYAKKANKINSHQYNYEFGSDPINSSNSRYQYEYGNDVDVNAKDSPLARGANIADSFSNPLAASASTASRQGNFGKHNEEYAMGQTDNVALQRQVNSSKLKQNYQNRLKQSYNVEFSNDDLIEDEDCCKK